MGSCLTLRNELSEETHALTKQEILLGKGTRVESSKVREPRRTALPMACSLRFYGDGISFRVVLSQSFWLRILLPGMHLGLSNACTIRKDSKPEWLARENSETNPITIKPETASHEAEQFSLVPRPYTSPPKCPFPIKSLLALSACVPPQTIHFQVLDKSELLGPRRGPSCHNIKQE